MQENRYARHSLIDWFDQDQIKKTSIVVVGAGATGNEVLKNLCLLGVGNIHIIDFDKIEIHNLTRSILFSEKEIGSFKAEVAAKKCLKIDANLNITYDTRDIWAALSIEQLRNYNALFCCVDNFEARLKLNKLCLFAQIDFYNTGIDSRYITVEKYPFSSDIGCACYQCNLPDSVYSKIKERYSCGWLKKQAFQEKKVPTTTITSSIAGAFLCSLFLQKNHQDSPIGTIRYFIDSISLHASVSTISSVDTCDCSLIFHDYHYFKANRQNNANLAVQHLLDNNLSIYLSDHMIFDVTCKSCGNKIAVNDLAANYDESLAICKKCNLHSNNIDIRDIMRPAELMDIFNSKPIPVKYLYFYIEQSQYLLEMEG